MKNSEMLIYKFNNYAPQFKDLSLETRRHNFSIKDIPKNKINIDYIKTIIFNQEKDSHDLKLPVTHDGIHVEIRTEYIAYDFSEVTFNIYIYLPVINKIFDPEDSSTYSELKDIKLSISGFKNVDQDPIEYEDKWIKKIEESIGINDFFLDYKENSKSFIYSLRKNKTTLINHESIKEFFGVQVPSWFNLLVSSEKDIDVSGKYDIKVNLDKNNLLNFKTVGVEIINYTEEKIKEELERNWESRIRLDELTPINQVKSIESLYNEELISVIKKYKLRMNYKTIVLRAFLDIEITGFTFEGSAVDFNKLVTIDNVDVPRVTKEMIDILPKNIKPIFSDFKIITAYQFLLQRIYTNDEGDLILINEIDSEYDSPIGNIDALFNTLSDANHILINKNRHYLSSEDNKNIKSFIHKVVDEAMIYYPSVKNSLPSKMSYFEEAINIYGLINEF